MNERIPMSHQAFERMQIRTHILDKVIEWKISQIQAWIELWVWDRQIRKLLKKYKDNWEEGLVHGLTWKQWNHHLKEKTKSTIIDVIKLDDFNGCTPIFITENLEEKYWVVVSKETVRWIMTDEKLREPGTKKHHIHRVKRPRKDFFWEMSQFDWSYHDWLENWEEWCLLLDIDDATGKIRYAKLDENEWYECVANFWMENILLNGVPKSIYLDKFSTYKVNHPKAVITKNVRTHFDKSLRKLWCNLISAHSPQAKWRVEKCNATLQQRLIRELRLVKIKTIEKANEFIKDIFIPKFNKQFWVKAKKRWNVSRKLEESEKNNLKWIFARASLRVLGNDYIIQYKNNFYQIVDSKNYTVYPRKVLLVSEDLNGNIRIYGWNTSENKLVNYKKIDTHEVRRNRAKYRCEKKKIEKIRVKQARELRKKQKYKESKNKQTHYKAQRLIDKL